jgi:Fic family protein
MAFDADKPFNDLPLLPPKAELETKAVLKRSISASRALAELKGLGELIPNQAMLINAIPLQEARLSSAIENIVTTTDELFLAAAAEDGDGSVDPKAKEVLRYRQALRMGYDRLSQRPLSTNLFCEICQTITDKETAVRKIPGTTLKNPDTGKVIYTPPVGEAIIREKLGNLEQFIHGNDDIDPLVKAAVIHYQFEAIHPFHDGNGRTGRIIVLLYLIEQDLLRIPVLYLSRYIIGHRPEYYACLRNVTERQAWEPWLIYMLMAIEETATETTKRIVEIKALFEDTCEEARRNLPPSVYSKELMEVIFTQPYCKIKFLTDKKLAERKTASLYLKALEEIGVLKSLKVVKEILYINHGLVDLLSR